MQYYYDDYDDLYTLDDDLYMLDDDGFVQAVSLGRRGRRDFDGFRRFPHRRDHFFRPFPRHRRFPRHFFGRRGMGFGIGVAPFGVSPFLFF